MKLTYKADLSIPATYMLVVLQQQEELKEKKDLSILRPYFSGVKELISASIYAGLNGNLPSIAFAKKKKSCFPTCDYTCCAEMVMEM